MAILAQLGGQQDLLGTLLWFALFFVFIFFYPRLMISQTIWKLEKDVVALEHLARKSAELVAKKIESRPSAKLRQNIRSFMDFFAVEPISVDPYGVVKKIDMIVRQSENRFKWFVNQIAPKLSDIEKANLRNALAGAMTVHQIAKAIRHMLEIIKKYKILQLALLLQMQMPLIARMAKSANAATRAFVNNVPIGDGIGPMIAASLIPARAHLQRYKDEEFIVTKVKFAGRDIFVAKADGPGATIGKPGKFLTKFTKKQKIDRIITVDAALRLEGEKTGSIAEGVGVAMGGTVERYEIEELAVKKNLPLDAIGIKVSDEEALQPMKKEILNALPKALDTLKVALHRAEKREKVLIIGVGNTCGIANTKSGIEEARKRALKAWKQKVI